MFRGHGPGPFLRREAACALLARGIRYGSIAISFIAAGPLRAAGPYAYIPNNGSASVSVMDLTSNTVTATITGITGGPWAAAVNSGGTRVFVTRLGGNAMAVIDTSSNSVIGNVTGLSKPYGVALNPAGTVAYVTNSDLNTNTVSVVSTASNLITGTIPVGKEPYGIAITPDGSRLFVANSNASFTGASTVSEIDTATSTVTGTITGFSGARGVAINAAGTRAYVTDFVAGTVVVLDLVNNVVMGSIPVGVNPEGVAVSPLGSPVYAAAYRNPGSVSVIDAGSNTVSTSFSVGAFPLGVAFHPGGGAAYVVNNGGGSVSVVSVPTSAVTGTASVQTAPAALGAFTVQPPRAVSLSPAQWPVGGGAFTLTVNGTMFNGWPGSASQVRWNGSPRATTYLGPNQITAAITAADVAVAGTYNITVNSPAPAGGLSGTLPFTVCTGPPSPGGTLRVTKQSPDVRLGWALVSGATGYNVKACAVTAGPCTFGILGKPVVNGWNDPVLGNAASYRYLIEAYNGCTYTP